MSSEVDFNPESWNLHCSHRVTCPCHRHFEQVKSDKSRMPSEFRLRLAAGNAEADDRLARPATAGLRTGTDDAEKPKKIKAMEDSLDKRAKVRGRAIKYEQMRIRSGREKLLQKNITFVNESEKQRRFKMEVMRQERSRKDVMDDLKMKNMKNVLMKLLNKTGQGKI